MTLTAVAVDTEEALHVSLLLTAKVAFADDLHGLDGLNDLGHLVVGQLSCTDVGVDIGSSKDFAAKRKTDAIDVRQRVFDLLFVGDVDSEEASHDVGFILE